MKKLLWGVLILLLILAAGGFYVFNMSGDSVAKKDADHTMQASALYAEYSANEAGSNKKYIGKTVELSGKISEISTDQEGATVLMFAEPGEMEGVMCTLEKSEDTASLAVGNTVKVKGQCTGMLEMTGVVVNKGVLVK